MNAITSGLRTAVAELTPGYFAMVMATGIVSISSWLMGIKPAAVILFRLNIALYAILWLLLLGRIIFYPRHFLADLGDHSRGAGYFTTVAGTCILGTQFVILDHALTPALLLLSLGAVLWIFLIYGFFRLLFPPGLTDFQSMTRQSAPASCIELNDDAECFDLSSCAISADIVS